MYKPFNSVSYHFMSFSPILEYFTAFFWEVRDVTDVPKKSVLELLLEFLTRKTYQYSI